MNLRMISFLKKIDLTNIVGKEFVMLRDAFGYTLKINGINIEINKEREVS